MMNIRAKAMKGQSAMEYLMTYGWAILIVVIVAAVLFSLGVFNPSTFTQTTATGFSGFNVPSGGFQMASNGGVTMQITNGVGATVTITNATLIIGGASSSNTNSTTFGPGQKTTLTLFSLGARSSGTAYSAAVLLNYNNVDTGLTGFISSGTLTGTVS